MSGSVQRLPDLHRARLLRLFVDLQDLCPDLARLVDAADIVAALRAEDYAVLHDLFVFVQADAFESVADADDSLAGDMPLVLPGDTPVVLPGVSTLTFAEWCERWLPANDPAFPGV